MKGIIMKKLICVFLVLVLIGWCTDPEDYFKKNADSNNPLSKEAEKGVQYIKNNPLKNTAADSAQKFGQNVLVNSFFAIFIVAMATALMYMAGHFFQLPGVLALAKQEINEIIMTTLIAIFTLSIIGFFSFPNDFFGSSAFFGPGLFQKATDYSYKMLHKISEISAVLISANIALNSIYTLSFYLGPINMAMSVQLGPVLRPLIDGVSFSLQFLITSYGEWAVFVFIFDFIQKWFLPFFLPIGIFLRAFPHTRIGGNAIIGISLALSTIYPLMFYLDSKIFDAQFPTTGTFFHKTGTFFQNAISAYINVIGLGGTAAAMFGLGIIYLQPALIAGIALCMYLFISMLVDVLHLVMIFSILLPILNIFTTLAFAREIAKVFGTEINISAFAKLI